MSKLIILSTLVAWLEESVTSAESQMKEKA